MNELINTELELRKNQGKLGNSLIVGTITVVIIIGALPLISTLPDNNLRWVDIIMSESYMRLIIILLIPLIVGLTAGIILIKSSVKNIAESYYKEIEYIVRTEYENEQNVSK